MQMSKYVQDVYVENYTILLKVIKDYLSNAETHCVWICLEASIIVKMSVHPSLNTIQIQIPRWFLTDTEKWILSLYGKANDREQPKYFWKGKAELMDSHYPILRLNSKAVVMVHRLMRQGRESRNWPAEMWSVDFWQRRKGSTAKKNSPFHRKPSVLWRQLDIYMLKNEPQTRPHTFYKNQLKIDDRLK